MIGIENIGTYLPERKTSNYDLMDHFDIDEHFIENKIGVRETTLKEKGEKASDLGCKAIEDLLSRTGLDIRNIDCLIAVTQNPDTNIPHISARIHGSFDFKEECACFDISLGCSGFVYGLSVIEAFMKNNGLETGILVTSDPYSDIIHPDDKNTRLLFGDGAAATLISSKPVFESGKFNFGTIGKRYKELICHDSNLSMNGRGIFNFAARYVPKDVYAILEKNNLEIEEVDVFLFHQGSKFIADTITRKLGIDPEKSQFHAATYGNTVSSSIPIMLKDYIEKDGMKNILISGFGVGLSWSSTILNKL